MSGGHDAGHGAAHDAGHGAGHGAAHGGGDHAAHGPAEIPPAPLERVISPARADFAQPWPGKGLLWPLVWTGVAGILALLAMGSTGEIQHDHEEGAAKVHGDSIPHDGPRDGPRDGPHDGPRDGAPAGMTDGR